MSVPNTTFRMSYIDGAENVTHIYCASADEAKQVAWGFIKSDVVIIRVDYKHEDLRDIYITHRLPKLGWSHEERWSDFEHLGTYKRTGTFEQPKVTPRRKLKREVSPRARTVDQLKNRRG